jgi:hypothetical protein
VKVLIFADKVCKTPCGYILFAVKKTYIFMDYKCMKGLLGKELTGMNTKVIEHIRFAKAWLDKAECQFRRNNNVQGELTLTLVQAELKYAWEKSRAAEAGVEQAASVMAQDKKSGYWSDMFLRRGLRVSFILMAILTLFFINTPYKSSDDSYGIDNLFTPFDGKLEENASVSNMGSLKEDLDMGLRQIATVFAQSGQEVVSDSTYNTENDSGSYVIVDNHKLSPQVIDVLSDGKTEENSDTVNR